MWVCGLKHQRPDGSYRVEASHPMWVCGLKHVVVIVALGLVVVTPYVGVWIETHP